MSHVWILSSYFFYLTYLFCNLVTGAHTLGRAKPSRSGFGKDKTKYTENGPGTPGGSSWTPEWLKFDNSYFTVGLSSNAVNRNSPNELRLHTLDAAN